MAGAEGDPRAAGLTAAGGVARGAGNRIGPLWGLWYDSGGAQGEERPASDPARQRDLTAQLLAITKEEFYAIGIAREVGAYLVAANDLRNIPEKMIQGFVYPTPRAHPYGAVLLHRLVACL